MFKKLKKFLPDGRHNEKGEEKLDPTPMEVPISLRAAETLEQKIARMLHSAEIRKDFINNGVETFEEADDFDVGDDYDPSSPYEQDFDVARIQEIDKGVVQAPVKPPRQPDPAPKNKIVEEKPKPKKDE